MLIRHSLLNCFYLLIVCLYNLCYTQNNSQIKAQIELDKTVWDSTAYLSFIPSLDDIYTMSSDMIITAVEIDSLGRFSFDASYLPEEDHIYRIHISKVNAPPMSLIIGGQEENHIFFIANKNSNISIRNTDSTNLFNSANFNNDSINQNFHSVGSIIKKEETIDINATLMERKLIRASTQEELRTIAQQNSNPLVALYALHNSDLDINNTKDLVFLEVFNKKWLSQDNTYFKAFRNKYIINTSNYFYLVFISIGLFLLGLGYALNHYYKKKQAIISEKQLQSLSVQERKILLLIKQGLSNKEISEECHIGLSTVKSHVSSIYSKLNVKSRKDIIEI